MSYSIHSLLHMWNRRHAGFTYGKMYIQAYKHTCVHTFIDTHIRRYVRFFIQACIHAHIDIYTPEHVFISTDKMAFECLKAFKGEYIVLVGEFMGRSLHPPFGLTGTTDFQVHSAYIYQRARACVHGRGYSYEKCQVCMYGNGICVDMNIFVCSFLSICIRADSWRHAQARTRKPHAQ